MNKSRQIFLQSMCFLITSFVLTGTALCAEGEKKVEPDQALIQAAKTKAKELGYNPIPVYVEKEGGTIIITPGVMLHFKNNQTTYLEGDMVINVGSFPISGPGSEFTLAKGEYMIVKDGKFVKQTESVISPTKWWQFWK